jgi:hypothetical protein
MRLTRREARQILWGREIPLGVDFHALRSSQVDQIIHAANARNYRAPKNANGSRARCFHAYLIRAASRNL